MKKNRKKMQNARQFKSENIMKCGKANRGFALVLIAVLTIATMCMGGCNSGTNDDEVTVSSETEEADVTNVTEEPVESEHIDQEPAVNETEVTDEVTGPQDVYEWAESLNTAENRVTIWNNITNEGTLLENGQEYIIREGDVLVLNNEYKSIITPLEVTGIDYNSTCSIFEFTADFETLTELPVVIEEDDGSEYNFMFYVISESYAPTNDSEGNAAELSEGEQWVMSLDYDEPKLVFWNDELGTQTVVEEGESYQMSDGDVMAVYLPEGYRVWYAETERNSTYTEIPCNTNEGYCVLEYEFSDSMTSMQLQLYISDVANANINHVYTITTP